MEIKPLTIDEKYDLFKEAIAECGSYLLYASDEDIKHILFEEFSIHSCCYLCDESLSELLDAYLIDYEIFQKTHELRDRFLDMERNHSSYFSVEKVKSTKEWQDFLELGDTIFSLVKNLEKACEDT